MIEDEEVCQGYVNQPLRACQYFVIHIPSPAITIQLCNDDCYVKGVAKSAKKTHLKKQISGSISCLFPKIGVTSNVLKL